MANQKEELFQIDLNQEEVQLKDSGRSWSWPPPSRVPRCLKKSWPAGRRMCPSSIRIHKQFIVEQPKAEANHCPTCVVRVGALGEGFGSKSAALCVICVRCTSLLLR
ncbi:uncharacterized protein LOC124669912 [Lolium rigidum]|uniref:uncharacterized protein LOC124669912 n=1 Tax=Lolium rigidum TaxID=89674 RepID=UPI001F5DBBA4|nr:uncharacterized protein LOC124669912 [Lolium rigidum]